MQYPNSIVYAAKSLGVDPWLLYAVIGFESGHNPLAISPDKKAFGLLQFRGQSIKDLGFGSGYELISSFPDYDSQVYGAVIPYLRKYYPFYTVQSFLMSVFYPAYRYYPEFVPFPAEVRKKNLDITIPLDYINRVYRYAKKTYVPRFLLAGLSLWVIFRMMKS